MREYRIIREIDSGGMGRVYEAAIERIDGIDERVAIKVPKESTPELRQLFVNEAKTARRLNHDHPHLVTIDDFGETRNGTPFLVMELVDGASVSDLCEHEPLSWLAVRKVARAMLDALDYLHRNDFVHRDISPRNILLGRDGRIKLIDFGLVKSQKTSDSGRVCGTPAYSSPEQLRNERPSPASDRFSLGAVLYRMAMARRPFGRGEPRKIIERMKRGLPPLPDDAPGDLVQVIHGLLAFRPQDRPGSQQALKMLTDDPDAQTAKLGQEVAARLGAPAVDAGPLPELTLSDAAAPVLRAILPARLGLEHEELPGQPTSEKDSRWMPMAVAVLSFVALFATMVAGYSMWVIMADHNTTPAQAEAPPAEPPRPDATTALESNGEPRDEAGEPRRSDDASAASSESTVRPDAREQARSSKVDRQVTRSRTKRSGGWVSTSYSLVDGAP